MRSTWRVLWLILGGWALVVARAAPARAGSDACRLLTEAEASAVVGKPGTPTPGTFDMLGPTCSWQGDALKVRAQLETDESLAAANKNGPKQTAAQRFDAVKALVKRNQAVAVSGVGQDAVWQTELTQLWVLQNKKVVVVTIVRGFSSVNDLPRAKAAALKMAARL